MKKVREINWECRSKWSDLKLSEYRYVSNQIKQEYVKLIKNNEMLDLESIVIIGREQYGYRCTFYVRKMMENTIIGSVQWLVNIPYKELTALV